MSFQRLREKLGQEPSQDLFAELCRLFETWNDGDISVALDYADEHMDSWQDKFRHAANIPWNRKLPVWWPLIRSYQQKVKKSLPSKWAKHPETIQHLTILELDECFDLADISPLKNLTNLSNLRFFDAYGLTDISPLSNLENLTNLKLSACVNLTDVGPLISLTNLIYLNLPGCWSLTNVSPLANLESLTEIDLDCCSNLHFLPARMYMQTKEEVAVYQEQIKKYYNQHSNQETT